MKPLMTFAVAVVALTGCQGNTEYSRTKEDMVRRCNRPDAKLDMPDMGNCFLWDRAADKRLRDEHRREQQERWKTIEADAKAHPEKYRRRYAEPTMSCVGRGMDSLGNVRMTCY